MEGQLAKDKFLDDGGK